MNLEHDILLDIALGNSRKTKTWKNQSMMWSKLLDRLASTTRTSETMAEYKAMGREQQSNIKDVGGFVGGHCANGSRSSVTARSLICLDADYADSGIWEDWELLFCNAAAVYSTHKHTPEAQRLRLVIPLAREVTPEEYPAVARKVAETLGIEKFDDSTYDVGRLMYWPSTSQDGEFLFKYVDAPLLDPDMILSTYRDWRDISSWPVSKRVAEVVRKSSAKQQDPLEKNGVVGAFCRAYFPIQTAIEEYIPTYQPCDEPNRYTYTEGSTAAGVVIFDDKFSHSFHATDPASGQNCNAWDLVRLHHFHGLDADRDEDTTPTKLPSYKAMKELALADSRVKAQIVSDRMAEAGSDFEDMVTDETDWKTQLKVTEKGALAQTIENAVVILNNDPKLEGRIALDEMANRIVALSSLPWRRVKGVSQWVDGDDAALRYYLERVYGITGKDRIYDAVNVVAQQNAFHPVREYLDSCEWDGIPRVETLLVDYMGAEDTEYTRTITRKVMAAAVARIYNPGCKFDHMLTLRGCQGLGKSSFIGILGGQWFSDTLTTVQGKEAYEQIQGVWIVEMGELAGLRKAEVEATKQFLTKRTDRFRPAYGRRTQEFPRQCIFIGSTNESQFLRDTTGNRRFWVVDTPNEPPHDFWKELTPERVKLIWGEAVEVYRNGETLFLSKEMEAIAREVQEAYEEENPKVGLVRDYLERLLPENWEDKDTYERRQWLENNNDGTVRRECVCTMEIWAEAMSGNPDKFDRYVGKEIRDILEKIPEWKYQGGRTRTMKPYGQQRFFAREAKG